MRLYHAHILLGRHLLLVQNISFKILHVIYLEKIAATMQDICCVCVRKQIEYRFMNSINVATKIKASFRSLIDQTFASSKIPSATFS
jgi:hypothetical protein